MYYDDVHVRDNLTIKYCEKCGEKLDIFAIPKKYDTKTGDRLYMIKYKCKNKTSIFSCHGESENRYFVQDYSGILLYRKSEIEKHLKDVVYREGKHDKRRIW